MISAAVACALVLAQSASLLADPSAPRPFVRPGASIGYQTAATGPEVDAMVRAAQACPPGVAYSGVPQIAFLARRRMPAGQPDPYIIANSTTHRAVLAAAQADQPRCP